MLAPLLAVTAVVVVQVDEAEANVAAAQDHTRDTARRVAADVQQALANLQASQDKLATSELQVQQADTALSLAETRYRAGVITNLEVLDAQRSLFDAQLAESQAELQELVAAVRLYKALGGSWPDGAAEPH